LFQISGSRSGHLFFGGRIHSPVERHSNHPQGMKQLINPPWITAKGVLFLFLGLLSGTLLFLERPTARVGLLLAVTVWSSCRFYYFAFYVMQNYVNADYKFAGLLSLARHLTRKSGPFPPR
jgi:hypothetical protein